MGSERAGAGARPARTAMGDFALAKKRGRIHSVASCASGRGPCGSGVGEGGDRTPDDVVDGDVVDACGSRWGGGGDHRARLVDREGH